MLVVIMMVAQQYDCFYDWVRYGNGNGEFKQNAGMYVKLALFACDAT